MLFNFKVLKGLNHCAVSRYIIVRSSWHLIDIYIFDRNAAYSFPRLKRSHALKKLDSLDICTNKDRYFTRLQLYSIYPILCPFNFALLVHSHCCDINFRWCTHLQSKNNWPLSAHYQMSSKHD